MPIFADSLTRPFKVRVAKDMADLIQCFRLKVLEREIGRFRAGNFRVGRWRMLMI